MIIPKLEKKNLSEETRDSRSLIIELLGEKYPLSAKEVHRHLTEYRSNKLFTYQAIHKTLVQLLNEKVAKKNSDGKYQLTNEWIEKIHSFSDSVSKKYSNRDFCHFGKLNEKESVSFAFPTLNSYYVYTLNECALEQHKYGDAFETAVNWYHVWPITSVSSEEYTKMKKVLGSGKHYGICRANTKLDNLFNNFWIAEGKKSLLGVKCSDVVEKFVMGDIVLDAYIPPAMKLQMDRAYSSISTLEKTNFAKLYSLYFNTPTEIKITLTRNQDLANEYRKDMLSFF